MKLASFQVQTPVGRFTRIGHVQQDNTLVDLSSAYAALRSHEGEPQPYRLAEAIVPPDMKRFIEAGNTALKEAQRAVSYVLEERPGEGPQGETLVFAMSDVILLPPLPHPNSLRDFILFEGHFRRAYDAMGIDPPEAWYKMPIYYKGNAASILGHEEDLIWPGYTEKLDYELEMAMIIGKEGRNIKGEDAGDYIFGFSCFNDFSARDIQSDEMSCRLGPAKGKDFGTAIGPWIVTKDEVGDFHNLNMTARVNGEVWSQGNCREMYHSWERMIQHVSMEETIYPSDVFGSGTANRGCGLEIDRWLQPNDVVEIEIENVGVLRNRVVRR
jgi:2-keto-4-pentenoate hydratase/2-oxohepta-3-ene-1,7-dioic acid hydratase in catechol pathway